MFTVNGKVACKAPGVRSIKAEVNSGFAIVKNKVELVPLVVVFSEPSGPFAIPPGTVVYVAGQSAALGWWKEEFEVASTRVILVPTTAICLVEVPIPPRWVPPPTPPPV